MYDTHVITRNVAQCRKCGDTIESTHRHDFVRCGCDAIFLDGGTEYIRYGGDSLADIKLLTETRSKTREEVESDLKRYSNYTGDYWNKTIAEVQKYLDQIS
jgi:hypothetical protein